MMMASGLGAEDGKTGWVVVLALVTLTSLAGNVFAMLRGGKREVSLTDKPLSVQMEEQFATRREFNELKGSVRNFETKMEGLMERMFDKMDTRDKALTEKIEACAESAYKGRQLIHERVNNNRERIATVESAVKVCPRPPHCESKTHKAS